MSTRTTKIPAIRKARDVSPELHNVLEAIKQLLETREGLRGDPLDRFITVRELRSLMSSDQQTVVTIAEALDHGELLGLSDDDHTQYYNSIRLNAWTGSTSVVTLGTITTGTWQGSAIANTYISGIDQNLLTTSSPTFVGLTVGSLSGVIKASAGVLSGSATQDDLPDGTTYKQYNPAYVAITGGSISGIASLGVTGNISITGNLETPDTTYADPSGVIYKAGGPFIHNFNYGDNGSVITEGHNTFIGKTAGNFTMGSTAYVTSQASYNVGIGPFALSNNTVGNYNSAIGPYALINNTIGNHNMAIGAYSLYHNIGGYYNTAVGPFSLVDNTEGHDNLAIGSSALTSNTTGYENSAIGNNALNLNSTGYCNLALGPYALANLRPTSRQITAFADYSGTVAGTVKATSSSHGLTGIVDDIRISGTMGYNGVYTITVIDADNFYFTHSWSGDDATGWWSKDTEGRYNTGIGYSAGDNLSTGSNNIIIGYNIDAPSATGDNQLNIGDTIYGDLATHKVGIATANPGGLLGLADSNTYIDVDANNNMTFTDANTGTRTLKNIGCPVYHFIKATAQAEGDLHLSDATNWGVNKAIIKMIRVITSSIDWDLYLLQNDNGYAVDDANIPKILIMEAGNGNANILLDYPYHDEDESNEVHLYYIDNAGTNTADIYIIGTELI